MSRKEMKFKQTEIGMIPEDWEVKKFESIFRSVNSRKYQIQTIKYQDSGKYAIVDQGKEKIIGWTDRQNPLRCSQNGMIVFGDHTRIFKFIKFDFFVGADGTQLLECGDCVCTKYMYYVCSKLEIPNTGYNRHFKYLKESLFQIPPTISEQQRISTTLSDVDRLIESLGKLIAKKKRVKQGAMQQLLTGKKRLPGFGPKASCRFGQNAKCAAAEPGFKQTEIGMIPEDWEVKKFGDVGKGFSTGATPYRQVSRYYEGNVKWVSSGELDYNIIQETHEHISFEAVGATNLTIQPKGTFLMAITGLEAAGTRGRCAILGCDATTNQSCLAIYETEILSVKYLYHFYVKFGGVLAFAYAQGSKQQSYTAAIVKNLPIILPSSKAEQTAIAQVLGDMDSEIQTLEAKLAKYRKLKIGMMQQLLTGKIRLV